MNIKEADDDSLLDQEELGENPRSINATRLDNEKETALNEKSLMQELSKLAQEQSTQETHFASKDERGPGSGDMEEGSMFLM